VTNFDDRLMIKKKIRKHGNMFPISICGISIVFLFAIRHCDKTNVLISLLESPYGVRFENVYIYSKSLQQLKYRYLKNLLAMIEEIGYFTYSNNNDIVSPSEALPNSIFIFDDVACDKQDAIREYFQCHADVDSFYLCQTYAKIPKHLIRDDANLLILFKQEDINLKHVYNDHVNTDMSYEDFCELCRNCWRQKYGFLVIDKDSTLTDGRYRKGFNDFAIP